MITLVGGNIQNAGGSPFANASLVLELNKNAFVAANPFGFVGPNIPVVLQFDNTGNLVQPAQIWSNAELLPSTTISTVGSITTKVIQVPAFDPTLWAAGSGPGTSYGCNGYNAFSVYLDKDGRTAWAFEYPASGEGTAAGFARFNLSDGSIIHQGAISGQPGTSPFPFLDSRENGTVFWQQDDAGYYYTSARSNIYKFHIAPGPAANLLDGYCVVDAIFLGTGGYMEDMVVWKSGGVHYLAWAASNGTMSVIDADAMTIIGSYVPSPAVTGWKVFADSSHVLWAVFGDVSADSTRLVRWNPADGAAGFILNVTSHTITDATLGTTGNVNFGVYVPSNNSVLLGNFGTGAYTNDLIGISLSTFTRTALVTGSATLSYDWTYDAPESAFDTGVQADGSFGIPGDILVSGSPSPTQMGGILNIINPVTLALTSSVNVTAAINAAGVATPVPAENISGRGSSCTPPFANLQFAAASSTAVVTFDSSPSGLGLGSPVYICTTIPTFNVIPGTFYYATILDSNGAQLGKQKQWQFSVPPGSVVNIGNPTPGGGFDGLW